MQPYTQIIDGILKLMCKINGQLFFNPINFKSNTK